VSPVPYREKGRPERDPLAHEVCSTERRGKLTGTERTQWPSRSRRLLAPTNPHGCWSHDGLSLCLRVSGGRCHGYHITSHHITPGGDRPRTSPARATGDRPEPDTAKTGQGQGRTTPGGDRPRTEPRETGQGQSRTQQRQARAEPPRATQAQAQGQGRTTPGGDRPRTSPARATGDRPEPDTAKTGQGQGRTTPGGDRPRTEPRETGQGQSRTQQRQARAGHSKDRPGPGAHHPAGRT
jgi:hypothetical protein